MTYALQSTVGAGTVSGLANGSSVTGVGTNFQSTDVGKIIVVGSQWRFIKSRTSTTSIFVERSWDTAITAGTAYSLTTNPPVIIESGVDTLDALLACQGVDLVNTGDSSAAELPRVILQVDGSVTNANPAKLYPRCYNLIITATGSYDSGTFAADGVTALTGGCHFECVNGPTLNYDATNSKGSYQVRDGGTLTCRGGFIKVAGAIYHGVGSHVKMYDNVDVISSRAFTTQSTRIRHYTTDSILSLKTHDVALDLFRMPSSFSIKAYGSEYLAQYVGGAFAGGADAYLEVPNPQNFDGTYDFDNYSCGYVVIQNSEKATLNVTSLGSAPTLHCTPQYQRINFTVTDLAGVLQAGVSYYTQESPVNSPTSTITTIGGLKTWDFRFPLSYSGQTNVSGFTLANLAHRVFYSSSPTLMSLRFPLSSASFRFYGYNVRKKDVSVGLLSAGDINVQVGMAASMYKTLSEAQAAALTNLTYTPFGLNEGTVISTGPRTLDELWCGNRYFHSQGSFVFANDAWEYDGNNLSLGAWTANIAELSGNGSLTVSGVLNAPPLAVPVKLLENATWNVLAQGTFASGSVFGPNAKLVIVDDNVDGIYDGRNSTFDATTIVENITSYVQFLRLNVGQQAPTLLHTNSFIQVIYGDTDSIIINDLDNAFYAVHDDSDSVVEYAGPVSGTVTVNVQMSLTGTWNAHIRKQGHDPKFVSIPLTGGVHVIDGSLTKRLNPDGSDTYTGVTDSLITVALNDPNPGEARIDVGNGSVDSQIAYNMVEDALVTQDGIGTTLYNTFMRDPLGYGLHHMSSGLMPRRRLATDSQAQLVGILSQADGIRKDESNGGVDIYGVPTMLTMQDMRDSMTMFPSPGLTDWMDPIDGKFEVIQNGVGQTILLPGMSEQLTALVDNINPTNSLLTDLTTAVISIPTNPVLADDTRLDHLDADVSSVSGGGGITVADIEASTILAKEATVTAIPTNPLLVTDSRINHLDKNISDVTGTTLAEIEASTVLAKEATLEQVAIDVSMLPNDPASQSTILAAIDALPSASDVWNNTTRTLTVSSGMTPEQEATLNDINTRLPLNPAEQATLEAVGSDVTNSGLILESVKAQTDQMVFIGDSIKSAGGGSVTVVTVRQLNATMPDKVLSATIRHEALTATLEKE